MGNVISRIYRYDLNGECGLAFIVRERGNYYGMISGVGGELFWVDKRFVFNSEIA